MAQQMSVQVEKLSSDGMPSGGILGLQAEKGTVGLFVHSRCILVASLHTIAYYLANPCGYCHSVLPAADHSMSIGLTGHQCSSQPVMRMAVG